MGMADAAFRRWQKLRGAALTGQIAAADLGGSFTTAARTFRLFLQSAMLGVGAYLVLRGELTAGAMIAGSILLGRALAPVEQAVTQWPQVQRAVKGWHNLVHLLAEVPPEAPKTALPQPRARLSVQTLSVVPPGQPRATLRGVSFAVEPGQALGVIGPSGAGKSTLARAITGVWPPAAGSIRLDAAALDQYTPEALGRHIGYLPQRVPLFDGTIAENIARLAETPDDAQVVAAARKADAHEMILSLPDGYDTSITASGAMLSGGQTQRIGLARALYGDPVILVLDEPNANLDNEGSTALNAAIRAAKGEDRAVLLMAHRPSAIRECDRLMMLEHGVVRAFGPTEEVLRKVTQNHAVILGDTGTGGVQ
jgi:ATP-binding cassette subfamily C protein